MPRHRHRFIIVAVAALSVLASCSAFGATTAATSTTSAAAPPALQRPTLPPMRWQGLRPFPVRRAAPVVSAPVVSSPGGTPSFSAMRYRGGPVMTGPVRLYVVWYGSWARKTRRRAIITDFLTHLAGPRFAINTTYPDATGATVANSVTLAGQIFDRGSVGKRGVSDEAIGSIVSSALADGRLPIDAHAIYLVLTSTEVDKTGFLTRYCGWHSHGRFGDTSIKFALVGDPSGANLRKCAPQAMSPNGDPGADAMVNVLAHEIDETVTDPEFDGWSDDGREENADRCSWFYGTTYRVRRAQANVRLGRRHFYLQTNWVNLPGQGCALDVETRRMKIT